MEWSSKSGFIDLLDHTVRWVINFAMRLPGAKVQGNPTEEIRKSKYFYFSGWMMPLFSLNKISKWDQPFSYHDLLHVI